MCFAKFLRRSRFDGPRVDCEEVPLLPGRAVAWVLDDPRKIPHLFVWKRAQDSSVREAVRVSAYSELAAWAETKRPDGTRNLIRTLLHPLPRNGGKARLLICPYCKIPRRGLYGWELGGRYTSSSTHSTWGCRKCNLLRYTSEGGALLVRPRGTLGIIFGTGHSPRPESWLPRTCCGYLNQARGLSPLPQGKNNDAQLFAQTRTLRIRQRHGFDFSSEFSTSPLQAVPMLTLSDFHKVSRAGRP
jgi:hypothetical protein